MMMQKRLRHIFDNKIWVNVLRVGCVIFALGMVLPLVIAAFFSIPSADDFSNALLTQNMTGDYLSRALQLTADTYMTWQGTFLSTFLVHFFAPLSRGGIWGTKFTCACIVFFLAVSLFFVLYVVLRNAMKENICFLFAVYGLVLGLITSSATSGETLYWVTGGFVYTVPFSLMLLEIGFVGLFFQTGKGYWLAIAGVMAALATGGTLQVVAAVNVINLGLLLFFWKNKHYRKKFLSLFIIGLIGALINVVAPGNYMRHNQIDAEYYLFENIETSFFSVINSIWNLITQSYLLFLCFGLLGLGYWYGKRGKKNLKTFFLIFLYGIIGLIISDFPVRLGYGKDAVFPPRCIFVENALIVFFLSFLALYVGSYLSDFRCVTRVRIGICLIGVVISMGTLLKPLSLTNLYSYTPLNIWIKIADGKLMTYAQQCDQIFQILMDESQEEVVLHDIPDDLGIFPIIKIYEEDYWVNQVMAQYYNKKSLIRKDKIVEE